jgi:hypothetical protein
MSHFHLLWDVPIYWWHAWGAVVQPLAENLGILGLFFALCVIGVRYLEHRLNKKPHREALGASWEFFHDNLLTPFLAYIGLFLVLGFALGPYKVHGQDTLKVADRDSLSNQVRDLTKQLNAARNNLDIHSPGANNLMYMLQAFRSYRGMLGGYKPISCSIRLTAPANSGPIPSTVAQFSIQVTNCTTFGPMPTSDSPDEERDAVTGMVPEVIVFHSRRGDKAAFALFDNLSSLVPLQRSYEVPKGSPENFIWLQFGPNVQWNSQRTTPQIVH